MQHLDEGTIHAWLDGELGPAEREATEAHVAACDACKSAVAEARGFIAASSRILMALDAVPGGVLPASTSTTSTKGRAPRPFVISRAWMAAAAVLVLSTVTVIAVRPKREAVIATVAATDEVGAVRADTHGAASPMASAPMVAAAPEPARMPSEKVAASNGPVAKAPSDQKDALRKRTEPKPMVVAQAPAPQALAAPGPAPASRALEQPEAPPAPAPATRDAAGNVSALAGKMANVKSTRRESAPEAGVPVTGRVLSESGAPLGEASVQVEGTGIVTLTHDDGRYALLVPPSRADGKTKTLVARLIGYKAATASIAPVSDSVAQDFVLRPNPLRLGEVVVTGMGATTSAEKLGVAVNASDSASAESRAASTIRIRGLASRGNGQRNGIFLANGTFAELTTRTSSAESGEPVEISQYRVGADYITFIDRLRPDTTRATVDAPALAEIEGTYDKKGAPINRLAWKDSEGRMRTLSGPVSRELLQQLKRALDHPTP